MTLHPPRLDGRRLRLWALAIFALGLTFWAYLQPDLILDLATRAWSCF